MSGSIRRVIYTRPSLVGRRPPPFDKAGPDRVVRVVFAEPRPASRLRVMGLIPLFVRIGVDDACSQVAEDVAGMVEPPLLDFDRGTVSPDLDALPSLGRDGHGVPETGPQFALGAMPTIVAVLNRHVQPDPHR